MSIPELAVAAPDSSEGAWLERAKRWVRAAYLEPGTTPFRIVFDLSMFLVMVSLLSMVLEGAPDLDERYGDWFYAIELVVVVLFIADYAGSVYTAADKRAYIFSIWGLIDLLAILPFFLSFTNLTGLRAGRTLHTLRTMRASRSLRAVRMLRLVRVLKLGRSRRTEANAHSGHAHEHVQPTLLRDFQFGLIGVCTVVALAQIVLDWETEQLFWLAFGGGAAANLALRRWCLRRDHPTWAMVLLGIGLVLGGIVTAWAFAVADSKAVAIAIVTVLFAVGSAFVAERAHRVVVLKHVASAPASA